LSNGWWRRVIAPTHWKSGLDAWFYLSLTYDHRIVDGADAARYLTATKQRLEPGFADGDLE
jgi:pyruvate/2-oxoglutarate dehydrogenase complex dihydrolipoamide acyltransferase (E2) component